MINIDANINIKDNNINLGTLKELVNKIKELKIVTESGIVRGNQMTKYTLLSETCSYYNLTFKKVYTTPPTVMVCLWNGNKDGFGIEKVAVSQITTTGCQLLLSAYVNVSNYGVIYTVISND